MMEKTNDKLLGHGPFVSGFVKALGFDPAMTKSLVLNIDPGKPVTAVVEHYVGKGDIEKATFVFKTSTFKPERVEPEVTIEEDDGSD
jgi:hypothetical protein